jgi:hypothetical protein
MKTKLSKLKPSVATIPPEYLPKEGVYHVEPCIPKTAEQINGPQVGKITSDDAICLNTVTSFLRYLREMRACKYPVDGAHSFREWCVLKFGENLGCWIDSML